MKAADFIFVLILDYNFLTLFSCLPNKVFIFVLILDSNLLILSSYSIKIPLIGNAIKRAVFTGS
jgi:hypothetical protein